MEMLAAAIEATSAFRPRCVRVCIVKAYFMFGVISGAVEHIGQGHGTCTSTRVLWMHLEHCRRGVS